MSITCLYYLTDILGLMLVEVVQSKFKVGSAYPKWEPDMPGIQTQVLTAASPGVYH